MPAKFGQLHRRRLSVVLLRRRTMFVGQEGLSGITELRVYAAHERPVAEHATDAPGGIAALSVNVRAIAVTSRRRESDDRKGEDPDGRLADSLGSAARVSRLP
jgi:hypothetical protein